MNQLLRSNEMVRTESTNLSYIIEEFLGGGGQGEVYRARGRRGHLNSGSRDETVALKWYFPNYLRQDQDLKERLKYAVDKGPPSDRFLWPQELVQATDRPGFGYVMPLRDYRFVGMTDLVARRVLPNFRALVTASFELAYNYRQLHAKGLCYRDISFGNVFFDPENGEIRICDNDNVGIDGQSSAIDGTVGFMAPEIIRGEASPRSQTDLFSLAVLLFYMLVNHHPLEGARETQIRCFDLPAKTRLYGTHPIFIFDPNDDSNRPLPVHHDNARKLWPLYPNFVQDLFTRSFTEGLHDPKKRVRESQWTSALIRLRDSIFYCMQCKVENFYDPDALRNSGGSSRTCWECNSPYRLPPRMRIDHTDVVMLNHDTRLYPHHVDRDRSYEFDVPIAEIIQHTKNPQVWRVRNLSTHRWVGQNVNGQLTEIDPGEAINLSSGLRIQFGNREGEVRL
ncbi:MAG: serine/threonine protein kinase [Caldilineaceae bacterium SB0675_bin_29]|uniref:Serine/threonine protein kinase n=1 Tax=Caldilineaceae bacterium SB0675_bin_29 TaxID=2605266 RepID=A0A6B1G640_9CHLR|nr:serine/threonine protein kinase [Caldilineaceae bacterium SB0675_bin_29]